MLLEVFEVAAAYVSIHRRELLHYVLCGKTLIHSASQMIKNANLYNGHLPSGTMMIPKYRAEKHGSTA
jgi:hypothetical protein